MALVTISGGDFWLKRAGWHGRFGTVARMRAGTAVAFALPVVPVAARWRVAVLALVVVGGVLVWAQVAVAALSVCLNETPGLAIGLARSLPLSAQTAQTLLPLFGQNQLQACDPTAPARAMAVAGVAYLAALVVVDRGGIPSVVLWLVIGVVAASAQLALFFMPALLSSDILDYASHGRVAAIHAANPYLLPPSAFPSDPFSTQGAWPDVVTVYGPLWTRVDAAITGLLASGSEVQLAFAYKLVGLFSNLASIGLIWWIAGRWQAQRSVAVAMWAWNPLVNIELVGSAHNEAVMTVLVLAGFAFLTAALTRPDVTPELSCSAASAREAAPARTGPHSSPGSAPPDPGRQLAQPQPRGQLREEGEAPGRSWLWLAALVCLALGALVKFVPAGIGAIVTLIWLRRAPTTRVGLRRALVLAVMLAALSIVVAWPWLDSPAVAGPLLGLAAGGQRFKDVWQDAPAAWLTVRLVPLLGVPDDPATLRMDVARTMVWGVTRIVFLAYVAVEGWLLWRHADDPDPVLLHRVAAASVRALLMAILLFVTQVYPWYFLWPLPVACLLGIRDPWSRAAVIFGLAFLPAYYLREFQSYGVFSMPLYAEAAVALLVLIWAWGRAPRLMAAR